MVTFLQIVVPASYWFAVKTSGNGFALAGCTVSPGFSFEYVELPKSEEMTAKFPQHQNLIKEFSQV